MGKGYRIRMRGYAVVLAGVLLAGHLAWSAMAVGEAPEAVDQLGEADAQQGLSTEEWRSIEDLIQEAEYQVTWHEATADHSTPYHWAPNRAHRWQVVFCDGGVEVVPASGDDDWRWGLALAGFGYQGRMRTTSTPPTVTVDAYRLSYRWDESLTEWYVNTASGLKHGFTLDEPPGEPRSPTLQLDVTILGTLAPRVAMGGQAVEFRNGHSNAILRYDRLLVTDATGLRLPATLELNPVDRLAHAAGSTLRITVDDTDAVYPITVDPLLTSQVSKLTAGDGAAEDRFGYSVSISGDTVVVGAYLADVDSTIDQGAAYVFTRNEGGADGWGQVHKLIASDGAKDDRFGYSVSISGDTVVVGADKDDDGGSAAGSAYVFERNYDPGNPGTPLADNWGQKRKLTADDGAANDQFGYSVSISVDTIVVGAAFDDDNGEASGSAYVFARNYDPGNPGTPLADNWGQRRKLIADGGVASDWFGYSVSISGDVLVVGSQHDNSLQGAAYVFERNYDPSNPGTPLADNWGQLAKLIAGDGEDGDLFGTAVAISGDTVVVGAYGDDDQGNTAGAAYVFERNKRAADAWDQVQKLTASDGADEDRFGTAVAISSDTVVVGAYGDDDKGNTSGAAYLFERNEGGADAWGQVHKLTASDGAEEDRFGCSVSISGNTLAIGAYGDDDLGDTAGASYVFVRSGDAWIQRASPSGSDVSADDQFGHSVSISGDSVVVGARGQSSLLGAAYVFTRNHKPGSRVPVADYWGQVRKLTASSGATSDQFGNSVSISGDTVVVGAPGADDGEQGPGSGLAYVFERNVGGAERWGQMAVLTGTYGTQGYGFGVAVAISGDTIVVGANDKPNYVGAMYVFERNWGGANAWGRVKRNQNPSPHDYDYFGESVSISGDTIVVGAYGDDYGGAEAGRAWVFERNYDTFNPTTPKADNWGWVEWLSVLDTTTDKYFGHSVSICGDTVVVGARRDDIGGNDYQGSAYVFERNWGGADNWGQVHKLTASDGAPYDYFGWSASISGDTLVIGANGRAGSTGSAYVFGRNVGGADAWGQVTKLTVSGGAAGDNFGLSVSIDGNFVIVGAPLDTVDDDTWHGSAYIFDWRTMRVYLPLVLRSVTGG